jgi:hypothetical protein
MRFGAIEMDRGWFDPVPVTFGQGIVYNVNNVFQAADMLLHRWPAPDSPAHTAARRACLAFMEGKGTPEAVRQVFADAAAEAGILVG